MIKKCFFILFIAMILVPSSFAINKTLEINLDDYSSSNDLYNYKTWNIDNKKLPLYGEFSIRFNTNIYYKDIEAIALLEDKIQVPMKCIINNASLDCTILESLKPDKAYKIVIYENSKHKYTLSMYSEKYGDIEPNNTPLQSNSLIIGEKIEGFIDKNGIDYFTFNIEKPTELQFELKRDDNETISITPFVLDEFGNEYIEIDKGIDYLDTKVLYKSFFLPGKYYVKIENPLENPANYILKTNFRVLSSYYEKSENDTFETSEELNLNDEINNTVNFYKPDGNFDAKDVYTFYVTDDNTRIKIKYDSNKKGNYVILTKYKDPYRYDVVEEYKNKAADFEDKLFLDEGRYYIEVWNKAYKGVNYKLEIDSN